MRVRLGSADIVSGRDLGRWDQLFEDGAHRQKQPVSALSKKGNWRDGKQFAQPAQLRNGLHDLEKAARAGNKRSICSSHMEACHGIFCGQIGAAGSCGGNVVPADFF